MNNLSYSMNVKEKTIANFADTSKIAIQANADIFSWAMMLAVKGTEITDATNEKIEN